jgi:hypothetical protein
MTKSAELQRQVLDSTPVIKTSEVAMKLRDKCLERHLFHMLTAAMLTAELVMLIAGTELLVRSADWFAQPRDLPYG